MKTGLTICIAMSFVVLASAVAGAQDKKPTQEQIAKLFPGKWESNTDSPKFKSTVRKDRTYTTRVTIKSEKGESVVDEEGKWKVEKDEVTLTLNKPAQDGTKERKFTIVEINDKQFKSKSEQSPDPFVWTRVKE